MLNTKLDTLLAVASLKSFSKAAEALGLTQPAVSHHITLLEKEYGVKLIQRGRGEFRLTPEGETAVLCARRLKTIHEQLKEDLRDESKRRIKLRVGVTHTAESGSVTAVLGMLASMSSNIAVSMTTDTVQNLYQMLGVYELDMAIAEGGRQMPRYNYLVLDRDELVCVVPAGSKLAAMESISPKELKKQQLILRLPTSDTRRLFESSLSKISESIRDFNVIMEVDSVRMIKELVARGYGVSILPKHSCAAELRSGELKALPVEDLHMPRETTVIYPKDFAYQDILDKFVMLYRELERKD